MRLVVEIFGQGEELELPSFIGATFWCDAGNLFAMPRRNWNVQRQTIVVQCQLCFARELCLY